MAVPGWDAGFDAPQEGGSLSELPAIGLDANSTAAVAAPVCNHEPINRIMADSRRTLVDTQVPGAPVPKLHSCWSSSHHSLGAMELDARGDCPFHLLP